MQLDHINLCAPAELMELVREFYCAVLGFQVGARPDIPFPGYWLYAEGESMAVVHLLESNNHTRPTLNHLDHVAFRTGELKPVIDALSARGVEYSYLDFPDFNLQQIAFLDPCGVKIEVNAYKG